ncbi:hypothetical protein EV658_11571 [Phaeovulum veldkampii DSM 11550]|nr:hypothetical protein EV658_11571 [Phaeovulum veldkampii DSM 11550]
MREFCNNASREQNMHAECAFLSDIFAPRALGSTSPLVPGAPVF